MTSHSKVETWNFTDAQVVARLRKLWSETLSPLVGASARYDHDMRFERWLVEQRSQAQKHEVRRGLYSGGSLREWQYVCQCGFVTEGFDSIGQAMRALEEHIEKSAT